MADFKSRRKTQEDVVEMKYKQQLTIITSVLLIFITINLFVWGVFTVVFERSCGPDDLYERRISYTPNVDKSWVRFSSHYPSSWTEEKDTTKRNLNLNTYRIRLFISERGMDNYIEGAKNWFSNTPESIKKALENKEAENINVTKICLSGKNAFKIIYQVKPFYTVEQYYIKESNTRALFISAFIMSGDKKEELEKEIELVLKTIEIK